MLIRKSNDIPSSEITPKATYLNRRAFMTGAVVAGTAALAGQRIATLFAPAASVHAETKLNTVPSPLSTTGEQLTSLQDITHYNNFYEFGVDKGDPARNAGRLKTRPWTVSIEGQVKAKKTFDIDALLKLRPLEDRIYRHRCVEAWSMVIPWVGFPLNALLKQVQPTSKAKYVAFQSYYDRKQMPQGAWGGIPFPYVEGLRLDEAMNPLALLAVGLYGETLPNQDGAPIRLVVPWKYGFKSIKSIVKIRLVEKMPPTTWNLSASNEYGFFSNVNPKVDHPRWSQAKERRLGPGLGLFTPRIPTQMFNGYSDQVASMYSGMDLRKNF